MTDQLLWLETLIKGSLGLIMLVMPLTAAKVAGLPHGNSAFWPRLFGASLLAIAAAFAVEGYTQQINSSIEARGLGLGGAIAVNLVTVLSLVGTLIFRGVSSRRGYLLLIVMCLILVFLMLFEIANL